MEYKQKMKDLIWKKKKTQIKKFNKRFMNVRLLRVLSNKLTNRNNKKVMILGMYVMVAQNQ